LSGAEAASYHLPEPKSLTEDAWLVDWDWRAVGEFDLIASSPPWGLPPAWRASRIDPMAALREE
jgi:hypothetical protein